MSGYPRVRVAKMLEMNVPGGWPHGDLIFFQEAVNPAFTLRDDEDDGDAFEIPDNEPEEEEEEEEEREVSSDSDLIANENVGTYDSKYYGEHMNVEQPPPPQPDIPFFVLPMLPMDYNTY